MPTDNNKAKELADKVNYLFQVYRKDNGDKYTFSEVQELSGGKIHQSWLWKLANGKAVRPSADALKALSDFFGVDFKYWYGELNEEVKNDILLHSKEDIMLIATQATELTPEGKRYVLNLIKSLKENGFGIDRGLTNDKHERDE
jgi:transcriptional regulator with XRE-family HTH domain